MTEPKLFQKQPPEVFYKKKVSLEISQNSQESTFFTEHPWATASDFSPLHLQLKMLRI